MGGIGTLADASLSNLRLPATVALASLAVLGYMASHARSGKREFTAVDAMILAVVVAILGATAIPLLEAAGNRAKTSALLQNLYTFRSQIELYKVEHHGQPPVVYQGTFPQLLRATNVDGIPGPPGGKFPYGPYLQSGIPLNPFTSRSIVTTTEVFPPTAPSGNGGWLYHQPSGQITVDLEGFLGR